MRPYLSAILSLGVILAACNQRPKRVGWKIKSVSEAGPVREEPLNPAAQETGDFTPAKPGLDLVWKRYRAFEHGLTEGLKLDPKDFCLELGSRKCVDEVHLTVLGGNEPYKAGQFERAQSPTGLTAVAVDRVVLSACSKRLELDKKASGAAVVFKHFSLTGQRPGEDALAAQAKELYQRLLARDPSPEEVMVVKESLGKQELANDKLALMLCFAIGSSSENLLL